MGTREKIQDERSSHAVVSIAVLGCRSEHLSEHTEVLLRDRPPRGAQLIWDLVTLCGWGTG